MKRNIIILLLTFTFIVSASESHTCTSFSLNTNERILVAKNYDWSIENGLVIVNKRGVKKVALQYRNLESDKPARWVSRFGSVTFNQMAREMPMGGINESGLVVELLMLTESEYQKKDTRPTVSLTQWIQYQLDNFSTTQEVIESNSELRISPPPLGPGMHYFICDREGNSAVIEFLDGKFVCHTGEDLPVKVLANSTNEDSLDYDSGRFSRAARLLDDYDTKSTEDAVSYAFHVLDEVSQGPFTKWSIVYDVKIFSIHFKTYTNQKIRTIDIRSFDYSCKTPVMILDIKNDFYGDVFADFREYTQGDNRKLIENIFRSVAVDQSSRQEILEKLVKYPDESICVNHPAMR